MDYEKLLQGVKDVSKYTMKKVVFELDQRSIKKIKDMDLDKETERELILILKDRTFFDMLIINAFVDAD